MKTLRENCVEDGEIIENETNELILAFMSSAVRMG
jgi:hypothetical protein